MIPNHSKLNNRSCTVYHIKQFIVTIDDFLLRHRIKICKINIECYHYFQYVEKTLKVFPNISYFKILLLLREIRYSCMFKLDKKSPLQLCIVILE